jgi:hypothetical protein
MSYRITGPQCDLCQGEGKTASVHLLGMCLAHYRALGQTAEGRAELWARQEALGNVVPLPANCEDRWWEAFGLRDPDERLDASKKGAAFLSEDGAEMTLLTDGEPFTEADVDAAIDAIRRGREARKKAA